MPFPKIKKSKSQGRAPRESLRTTSTPVTRYYRPEPATKSSRQKTAAIKSSFFDHSEQKNTVKKLVSLIGRWVGVLLILAVFASNLALDGVVVKGPENEQIDQRYRAKAVYTNGVETIRGSSFWYGSKITLSSADFEAKIRSIYPEAEQVSAVIPLAGRRLQVKITTTDPLARLLLPGNEQAVIGANGKVLVREPSEQILSRFSTLPSLSTPGLLPTVGDQILTADELNLINLLQDEFNGSSDVLSPVSSIEYDIKRREFKVRFTGKQFYAKLTPERTSREQVGSLVAALDYFSKNGVQLNEYIDVRVEERVFIK